MEEGWAVMLSGGCSGASEDPCLLLSPTVLLLHASHHEASIASVCLIESCLPSLITIDREAGYVKETHCMHSSTEATTFQIHTHIGTGCPLLPADCCPC